VDEVDPLSLDEALLEVSGSWQERAESAPDESVTAARTIT
jgi:hypothetical protein